MAARSDLTSHNPGMPTVPGADEEAEGEAGLTVEGGEAVLTVGGGEEALTVGEGEVVVAVAVAIAAVVEVG